jgi:hypothetical protein
MLSMRSAIAMQQVMHSSPTASHVGGYPAQTTNLANADIVKMT